MAQFKVYTPVRTNRIEYAVQIVFKVLLQSDYQIVTDQNDLLANDKVINYSSEELMQENLQVVPHSILKESRIVPHDIEIDHTKEIPVFFKTNGEEIDFDVFAAIFYLITRYEEYLPHIPDKHQRFSPENSLAFNHGFLNRAIVHDYALLIKNELKKKWPDVEFKPRKFQFVNTLDIDNTWAYKHKGWIRTSAAFLRDLVKQNFKEVKHRWNVIWNNEIDPYDNYDFVIKLQKQFNFTSIFFFLVGEYGKNDKNISLSNQSYQSLVKHVNDYATVGLHPSYASNFDSRKLKKENNQLSETIHSPIEHSRQHFLKLHLPDTLHRLEEIGIVNDHSMGYASMPGFRASIAVPYPFFDLSINNKTDIIIHPFPLMEVTFKYYMQKNAKETLEAMKPFIDEVKRVNGTLYTVWHNDTISLSEEWTDWRDAYVDMIRYIQVENS